MLSRRIEKKTIRTRVRREIDLIKEQGKGLLRRKRDLITSKRDLHEYLRAERKEEGGREANVWRGKVRT